MKKIALLSLVMLLFVTAMSGAAFAASAKKPAAAAASSGSVNIAIVDLDEVVNNHPGVRKARQDASNLSRQKENEARTAADKEPDTAKKAQIVNNKRREYLEGEQKIWEPIFKDCQQAVREVSARQRFTYVFNKAVVLIGGTDITQDVIQQLAKKK